VFLFIIHLVILISLSECVKDKCYVLALAGGGDRGAYQAGVIKGLAENLPKSEVIWDIITGISVGAINTMALSLYPQGEEIQAANYIVEKWMSLKGSQDIYKNWSYGILDGLFFKSGLYDNSPLKNFLDLVHQDRLPKRSFVIGSTNFETARYETWDETTLKDKDLVNTVISSSSFPCIFPLYDVKNSTYVDGGVKLNVDISSGINRCLDMGFQEENIIIDVISTSYPIKNYFSSQGAHPVEVLERVFNIFYHDASLKDIDLVQHFFPKVQFRYLVAPTKVLNKETIPLEFSPTNIEIMIKDGIEDAIGAIQIGSNINLNPLIKNYKENMKALYGRQDKKINTEVVESAKRLSFLQ